MNKFILGKKLGMSQIFDGEGKAVPVTIVEAGPCFVTAIKSPEKDNYSSIQIGLKKSKHINKPLEGHLKKAGISETLNYLKEFRVAPEEVSKYSAGQKIDVSIFNEDDKVKISGLSKAKGFQGVVKRHGFKGAPSSHGTKHALRSPGSIGGGARAGGRVAKGLRMAGRMGGERVTVLNLKVAKVVPEDNLLVVAGAIPGRKGTLLEIST